MDTNEDRAAQQPPNVDGAAWSPAPPAHAPPPTPAAGPPPGAPGYGAPPPYPGSPYVGPPNGSPYAGPPPYGSPYAGPPPYGSFHAGPPGVAPPAWSPSYGMTAGVPAPAALSSAGKRFGAYLLDVVLVVCTLVLGWVVWSLVVWGRGQTPAKALLKMRVLDTTTGRAATWGRMALREIVGKSVLGYVTFGITTLVSCFMVLSEPRQGVWDKVASTVVVDDPGGAYA